MTENELFARLSESKLEAKDIGSTPNDLLWQKIQSQRKPIVPIFLKRKVLLVVAISASLASVAMYSSYHYIQSIQSQSIKNNKNISLSDQTEDMVKQELEDSLLIEKGTTPKAQIDKQKQTFAVKPQPTEEETIATLSTDTLEVADSTTVTERPARQATDTLNTLKDANKTLQMARKDTACQEKQIVYMKADPVKVQTKKVKYVKKKKKPKK